MMNSNQALSRARITGAERIRVWVPFVDSVRRELEETLPKITIFEGPMRADDVPGNRLLRQQIRTPIAHHYGTVSGRTAIGEGYCDGFVIGGGVSRTMASATAAAMANMPFFLQMVGTGITTTMMRHLGAVLSHAQYRQN